MTSLTGSVRLADIRSSALVMLEAAAVDAVASSRETLKGAPQPARTVAEDAADERLNTLTHGLGFALSAAGFAYLLLVVTLGGSWLRVASCGVYGASLMLMYVASTLMHATQTPDLKRRLQLFDHMAIYLLIAGTYTPFLAGLMQSYAGFALLACVWLLATVGIAIKVQNANRLAETSPLPCVGLGWIGLLAIKPLLAVIPAGGMALLLAGGAAYSVGVIFYCRDHKRYFHAIWHLFVMAGTAMHFCAVLLYVAR